MTATIALGFLGVAALTAVILGIFLVLTIWGCGIRLDRRPEDPPPASWLAKMGGELG